MLYFHEITDEQWEEMSNRGATWGEISEKYAGPDWCGISGEVVDPMGCWSLVMTRSIRCEDDCGDCDEHKKAPFRRLSAQVKNVEI